MNIVIPMGGRGSRFADAGYTFPKPLIEVGPESKPMVQVVVENLGFRGDYHFFVRDEHAKLYSLETLLRLVTKPYGRAYVVRTPEVTGGQADSVLRVLANWNATRWSEPLVVANSDQYIDGFHAGVFMDFIGRNDPACAVCTFHGTHPKWSFAEVAPEGLYVTRLAEKDPISTRACVGVYYFRNAALLMDAISQMKKDSAKQVRGEWYVSPAINELIAGGHTVIEYPVPAMWGLGTPEDLARFEVALQQGKVRI